MYDYIVIGGGIGGLYMGSILSKSNNILLLEKNSYLGGRALEIKFHNEMIKLGAGIGSPDNKNLMRLLRKLKINYKIYPSEINLMFDTKFNMEDAIDKIIKKYNLLKKQNNKDIYYLNVEQFIKKYFGNNFFREYNKIAEYKDYLKSDITYYIKHYPITDHDPSKYKLVSLKWSDLINKLENTIKKNNQHIKINFEVDKIKKIDNDEFNYYIINNKYKTKNIIFAITINNLQKIINQTKIININYNKYIGSIKFLRIYTYHKLGHNLDIPRYNIVDNEIEKIIVMSDKTLMISYSDNTNAEYWLQLYKKGKKTLINKLIEMFKLTTNKDIIIDDIYFAYWEEGVHYFNPTKDQSLKNIINMLSNPCDNIYVIGEMISYRQGWVEGALESVNRLILSK
jgi:hypothetical protein